MKEVKIDLLQYAFEQIIKKLQFEGIESIQTETDLYNKIPTHKWNILNKPEEVVVIGSLQDDIENIEKCIVDKNRPFTYVDFDRIASLLREISQIENPIE